MIKKININVPPVHIDNQEYLKKSVLKKLQVPDEKLTAIKILKRSLDARKKPVYRLQVAAYLGEKPKKVKKIKFKDTTGKKAVFIIGSGPAGLFAALRMLELGIRPVIFEQGKDADSRKDDIRKLESSGQLDIESNYCFGEGGAGTFSDGKLYTRSAKRGKSEKVLRLLVQHGAPENILIDSRPHIGSDVLPRVITSIRETITSHGGQINFLSRVTGINLSGNRILSVIINDKKELPCSRLIVAIGHSSTDSYKMLDEAGLALEVKPYAVGVRVEHPQQLIDKIQYGRAKRLPGLPPASYVLRTSFDGRGVYSFCMCPGGKIIPASTGKEELVLNGMSPSKRNSPFANSAVVTTVGKREFGEDKFAGLKYREKIEQAAFGVTNSLKAPAQRLTDFINEKLSSSLPSSSYSPGLVSYPVADLFPPDVAAALREGLKDFGKKMKGFITEEALLLAPETRTSAPVRVPRDKESLCHPQAEGLFPCGEGAGYSGGILSSALDGTKCAEAAAKQINP